MEAQFDSYRREAGRGAELFRVMQWVPQGFQ
jgi:hypothetical protein